MAKYIRKHSIIDAEQFNGEHVNVRSAWFDKHKGNMVALEGDITPISIGRCELGYWLSPYRVDIGDWIITTSDGESYPVTPLVFERNYEELVT